VILVIFGEGVATGAVGDEEQVTGARRIGHGRERGSTRVGDRTRRQAVDSVGIVGGLDLQIVVAGDIAVGFAGAAELGIDHRRV
jgi:hypothetical protein